MTTGGANNIDITAVDGAQLVFCFFQSEAQLFVFLESVRGNMCYWLHRVQPLPADGQSTLVISSSPSTPVLALTT